MANPTNQAKLLASALYEIRVLLAGYLGSANEGDPVVRHAAHLAYALHNEALAVMSDQEFDPSSCAAGLAYVDSQFGSDYTERFASLVAGKS